VVKSVKVRAAVVYFALITKLRDRILSPLRWVFCCLEFDGAKVRS
jgi:hypothetical protein